jgi:hypothetical protein
LLIGLEVAKDSSPEEVLSEPVIVERRSAEAIDKLPFSVALVFRDGSAISDTSFR